MGVVYKIKEDIRDFIINEKRANPQLSCRLLVDYVYKTFDITLSKSSINNLLKKTNLSSPVGRRPSGKAPRGFRPAWNGLAWQLLWKDTSR